MQRIEQLKLELSKAIKESPEYIEYKRLEAIIDKDPNLKRSIDEFRRQNRSHSSGQSHWASHDWSKRRGSPYSRWNRNSDAGRWG